jgi:microcystin degradation protein MlrC
MRQGTDDHPNKELQHRCAAMSAEGALAASLFTGFPHADITNAGLSAVVVTDGDRKLAEELRDELLGRAWVEREAFVYKIEPLQQSIARAKAMAPGDGPVVLLDHYDNCASGGTMDTTVVLAEILNQGLEDVAAFAIYDPAAVQQAIAAGIGAQVALSIGGKIAMPAIPAESPPLTVTGTVKTISNGRYRNRGPMARGVMMDMGAAVVDCAGVGVCTSDYRQLKFEKVRRPIYPLDLPNR